MTEDLELALVAEFPEIFRDYWGSPQETCMAWGCEHSDGWFPIVRGLCRAISHHLKGRDAPTEFKFTQVKEKFGTLRVYSEGSDDFICGAIRMAEEMSAVTCEVTGKPGQMCRKGFWCRTLSRDQATKDGYVVCADEAEKGRLHGGPC